MSFQKAGHAVAVETAHDEVKDTELVVVDELMVLELADEVVMIPELELVKLDDAEILAELLNIEIELVVNGTLDVVGLPLVLLEDAMGELVEMELAVDTVDGATELVEEDVADPVELGLEADGAAHAETEASLPE